MLSVRKMGSLLGSFSSFLRFYQWLFGFAFGAKNQIPIASPTNIKYMLTNIYNASQNKAPLQKVRLVYG